jgi:hypothetical protein
VGTSTWYELIFFTIFYLFDAFLYYMYVRMYNESITNFFIKYVLILYFGVLYDIPDECGPYLYKTIHKHR